MKDKSSVVAKNSLIISIGRISEFLFGMIALILVARYLGAKDFGVYAFIRGIGIVVTPIIACGTFMVLIREISVDKEKTSVFLSSAFILHIFLYIFVLLITTACIFLFIDIQSDTAICIYLVLTSQALFVMQRSVSSVFLAFEKPIYDSIVTIFTRIISVLFIIIVIFSDLEMIGLFSALTIVYFIGFSVAWILLSRKFYAPKAILNIQTISLLLKESWPLSISNLIIQGYMYINVFMLQVFSGPVQISFYQIPQRTIEPFKILPRSIMTAFLPTFSILGRSKNMSRDLLVTYQRILKYLMVCFFPLCIFLTIYASPIVLLLFGKEFSGAVIPLQISIWTLIVFSLNILQENTLTALMKQKVLIVSNSCCLLVVFLLGLYLISHYAAVGASIAIACGSLCMFALNYIFIFKYLGQVNLHSISIRPIFFSSAVMWILATTLSGYINFILLIPFALALYISMIIYLKTFSTQEIDLFKGIIQKMRYKFSFSNKSIYK